MTSAKRMRAGARVEPSFSSMSVDSDDVNLSLLSQLLQRVPLYQSQAQGHRHRPEITPTCTCRLGVNYPVYIVLWKNIYTDYQTLSMLSFFDRFSVHSNYKMTLECREILHFCFGGKKLTEYNTLL